MKIDIEFVPRDLWIGAYWKRVGNCTDLWICIVPCFPIHLSWWPEREQERIAELRERIVYLELESQQFSHLCNRLKKHWPNQTKEFGAHVDDLVAERDAMRRDIACLEAERNQLRRMIAGTEGMAQTTEPARPAGE